MTGETTLRKFKYYEYWPDITEGESPHKSFIVSEDDIIEQYWTYWCSRMKEVGKEDLISRENCIVDFCVIHWAVEVFPDEY